VAPPAKRDFPLLTPSLESVEFFSKNRMSTCPSPRESRARNSRPGFSSSRVPPIRVSAEPRSVQASSKHPPAHSPPPRSRRNRSRSPRGRGGGNSYSRSPTKAAAIMVDFLGDFNRTHFLNLHSSDFGSASPADCRRSVTITIRALHRSHEVLSCHFK
jgi:hypothetical protein